jgi:hypothetical protein
VDQVRPAQPDLLVEAQLIQLLQMLADHDATPFGFSNRRQRREARSIVLSRHACRDSR